MADINLLQNKLKDTTQTSSRRTSIFATISGLILLLLVGACVGLYFLTKDVKQKTESLMATNIDLKRQLNNQKQGLADAKAFQAQLSNIKLLLEHHISLSAVFDELGKFTYQRAQYVTLDVGEDSSRAHLEGRVTTYNDLGKLLLGLSLSPKFKDVRLLTISPSRDNLQGYAFVIDMNIVPDLFVSK